MPTLVSALSFPLYHIVTNILATHSAVIQIQGTGSPSSQIMSCVFETQKRYALVRSATASGEP
eukprot:6194322-Pleurochrysis_carterae.AAC.1